MIYFIQDTDTGAIKIGYSKKPADRMRDLQNAHAGKLILLAVMDGDKDEEQALHPQFRRINGEWFEPSASLCAYIRTHGTKVWTPPPAPVIEYREMPGISHIARWTLRWLYHRFVRRAGPRFTYTLKPKPAPAPVQRSAEFDRILNYFRYNDITDEQFITIMAVTRNLDGSYVFLAEKAAEYLYGKRVDDATRNAVTVQIVAVREKIADRIAGLSLLS